MTPRKAFKVTAIETAPTVLESLGASPEAIGALEAIEDPAERRKATRDLTEGLKKAHSDAHAAKVRADRAKRAAEKEKEDQAALAEAQRVGSDLKHPGRRPIKVLARTENTE